MESSFIAKVIALGRITVPQTTRELLEIKPGDFVEVDIRKVIRRRESEFKQLAVREARKEEKTPTMWIREQIRRGGKVEVPVE